MTKFRFLYNSLDSPLQIAVFRHYDNLVDIAICFQILLYVFKNMRYCEEHLKHINFPVGPVSHHVNQLIVSYYLMKGIAKEMLLDLLKKLNKLESEGKVDEE